MPYDFNASAQSAPGATGTVKETVVRINDQPVYSGSRVGASVAVTNAVQRAQKEGSAEPVVIVSERVVDYDTGTVTETEITL